ncbi:MAG TPA: ABC transporter substrate-binding protein [Mycobacteriales bacterium]|nr:ABC transporter substrate-binding protein [Mycobacteriales bacterium]
MRITHAVAGLAAATTALTVLAACSSDPTQKDSGGGSGQSTLNVYLYQKPKLFSPLEGANGPDQIVMSLVYDSLLGQDGQFNQVPHLATSLPKVSPDAKTFTFTLRQGLKWSDGKPFTAKDVLYTYNLLANVKSGSATPGNYSGIAGYDAVAAGKADTLSGLSAPNDHTFVIKTSKPDIGIVGLIGGAPILPEHVLGKDPIDQVQKDSFFTKPTVGMGPYTVVTYKTDQYVELTKNKNFRSPLNIDKIYLKPVTSDVATAQLESGEMDLVQISPTDLPTVEKMKNVAVVSKKSAGYIRIALNQSKPEFQDKRVRQAVLYAVDRKKLIQKVLGGKGTVVNTTFMKDAMPKGLNQYPYDPAKARQLLAQAGWDKNRTVELEWIPGQRDRDTTVNIVQSQLQAVGMKVKLRQVQSAQLVQSYDQKSFDMVLYGGGNYSTDPWSAQPILACSQDYPNGANVTHFCDHQLDAALDQANQTTDTAARMKLYQKAAKIENEDAAYYWLYNPDTIWAYNTRIQGFEGSGDFANPFLDIADWKLK